MRLFSRLSSLVRGALREWLGRRERRNPAAVFEAAIGERLSEYARLRDAAAGVLYLRRKLARQLETGNRELTAVDRQIDLAIDRDDDDAALFLIGRKDRLKEDAGRLERELVDLAREAEDAKRGLAALQTEIERLREEKARALARLANARARIAVRRAVADVAADPGLEALEGVRELVERTIAEAESPEAAAGPTLEGRLAEIRTAQASEQARSELLDRKRRRRGLLLPLIVGEKAGVRAS